MVSETKKRISKLKEALGLWVQVNCSISLFAKETGYSYQHAWSLISGKSPITDSVIGRFVLTYGVDALGEWFSLAKNNAL